jgi:hypothetical protein
MKNPLQSEFERMFAAGRSTHGRSNAKNRSRRPFPVAVDADRPRPCRRAGALNFARYSAFIFDKLISVLSLEKCLIVPSGGSDLM